jgi:hypothetical protein
MNLNNRLATLERAFLPPEPHRHPITKIIVLEPPAPDDAAIAAWEQAQPACDCDQPGYGTVAIGVAGAVRGLDAIGL